MSDQTPPPPSEPPLKPDVPLEDIDRLLGIEDPEFTKSLEEVRAVTSDQGVTIEASVVDETLTVDEKLIEANESRATRIKMLIRLRISTLASRIKASAITLAKNTVIFLRTRPKDLALYSLSLLKAAIALLRVPLKAYAEANRLQRFGALFMLLCFVTALWVLLANLRGVWLPQLNKPVIRSFTPFAEFVETYDPKDDGESFYSAFPQERFEYLFSKMKVNLKRTEENPDPMGAFEIVVLLDSKDTAIEVRDREIEFSDLLQRVFEDETFTSLETEQGKERLKSRLKRELNQKLTQGWAKDINFKNFILKP